MSGDIEAAYSTALKLPEAIHALLHTSLSITALIEWALPPIDSTHPRLIFHPAKFALVNYQPQDLTGTNLLATPIPHTAWLDNAHKALKASFEDGSPPRAIADPRYKDQFLPVWVLTAWRRLSFLVTQQKKCGAVWHWLDENAEPLGGLVQEVHDIFNQVLWDGEARTPSQGLIPITKLFCLLADGYPGWLTDDVMDLCNDVICEKMDEARISGDIMVPTVFLVALKNRKKAGDYHQRQFREIVEKVRGGQTRLYMDACVSQTHWEPMQVDFVRRELTYGVTSSTVILHHHLTYKLQPIRWTPASHPHSRSRL
jgi:hypothetical protein